MWKTVSARTLASLSAALWAFSTRLASAQATCTLNGRPVPCEELGRQLKGFLGLGIGIFAVFAILGIAATIFWILMLVHAASHPIESKALWIILIVLTGILGALIYYFAVKRKFTAAQAPPGTAAQA